MFSITQPIVLVTGASGLVGQELISQLRHLPYNIKAIYHKTEPEQINASNITYIKCDLLDVVKLEEIMEGVSFVYHCAGLVKFTSSNKSLLYKINVEATANIVNAALDARVKKIVHVSSVAALGRMNQKEPITENTKWTKEGGGSVYGHTKFLGELEIWRGIAEGLNAVVVNPSIILGAGNWNDGSTAIFKRVYEGLNWYTEGTAGFVDVRDVCKAMILLMQAEVSAERYIISGENCTFRKVFDTIADEFNVKRPAKKVTALLSEIVWRAEKIRCLFTRKEPLITKETAASALAKVTFDNSKLLKQFPDFQYMPISASIKYHSAELLRRQKQLK
jgi:dihydroflavonol-4-reductase